MSKKIFGGLFLAFGIILEIIGYVNYVSEGFGIIFIGTLLIILGSSMIVIGDGEDGYSPKEKVSKSFFDEDAKEDL